MSHNNHNKKLMTNKVSGYNGIMDLDLTNIPEQFKKQVVEQHIRDIQEYKLEQALRPKRLRYENTIIPALEVHRKEAEALRIAREKEEKEWMEKRTR